MIAILLIVVIIAILLIVEIIVILLIKALAFKKAGEVGARESY